MGVPDEHLRVPLRHRQFRHLDEQGLVFREEFMERRVDEPDDDRKALHRTEDAFEVCLLEPAELLEGPEVAAREVFQDGFEGRETLLERGPTVLLRGVDLGPDGPNLGRDLPVVRGRQEHFVDDGEPIHLHEHVCGPVQADPLGAESPGALRVARIVGVRPDLEATLFVRPPQERLKVGLLLEIRIDRGDAALEDLPGAAVNGHEIAAMDDLPPDPEKTLVVVDDDRLAAGDAGNPEAPGHDRGMARRAPSSRQDALRVQDPVDVVGRCFHPDEHDRFLLVAPHPLRFVRWSPASANWSYTAGKVSRSWPMVRGVRIPATTSSPWAFDKNSPNSCFSPVEGFRVNATPVPESGPMFPKTIVCTFAAVPRSWGILLKFR